MLAIIVLSPVLLIVALLVRTKLGSPVIFTQNRPGKDEKIFKLYKFRSMTDQRDSGGNLLADDIRLTSFGRKLRSTSLDELPELFNILKGDMSIVGPRPLATEYLPYYNEYEKQRHNVLPGLTGLAQVNGRNSVQWEKRFDYDVKYIKHITPSEDIKISASTTRTTIKREDISVRGEGKIIDFDKYRSRQLNNKSND